MRVLMAAGMGDVIDDSKRLKKGWFKCLDE